MHLNIDPQTHTLRVFTKASNYRWVEYMELHQNNPKINLWTKW